MEQVREGLPEQWAAHRPVMSGKRDRGIHLFLLAEEGVSDSERGPRVDLRRGVGRERFQIDRACRSISGNQQRTDSDLQWSG